MKITIEIDDEKKVIFGTDQTPDTPAEIQQADPIEEDPLDPEEAERYAAASDLANCCEYLKDSELINLKLVIQKCEARKERGER